jgi:hypothetical protein
VKSFKELYDLILKLPKNEYLTIEVEGSNEEDGEQGEFVSACLFMKCPEDGWPNRAAYFGHLPDSPDAQVTDFPWKYDDSVLVGTSVHLDEIAGDNVFLERVTWMLIDQAERRK